MMNKNCRKAWCKFCQTISQIDEQDTAPVIFQYLRTWYQENKMFLSPHLIDEYRLEDLINIDTTYYPIERSEFTPKLLGVF